MDGADCWTRLEGDRGAKGVELRMGEWRTLCCFSKGLSGCHVGRFCSW